jgi:hypothetical protein
MDSTFTLKDDCSYEDLQYLQPTLWLLITSVIQFAEKRNLPVVFTSIISDRGFIKSVSTTHEDGRAIDVSTKGWSDKNIEDCILSMEYLHGDIAAISSKDLEPRPVVYHNYNGQGDHLHLQVRR